MKRARLMSGSAVSGDPAAMDPNVPMHRRDLLAAMTATVAAGACRAAAPARVSLFDYLPPDQQRRIVEGRSSLDCASIVERALRETIAAGAMLWLPRGTYLLQPGQRLAHTDPNFECLAAIRMVSGMRIGGETGATLRIVPGFSTDQRPRAAAMFATTTPIADVEIAGLTLDMNGRNNPISPNRQAGDLSRIPQAHIFVSSRDDAPAARIDRIRINDTVFRDANGVSCIVMGQNSDPHAPLGRGWQLRRCAFEENGLDTDDHSSIFAYAQDVTVDHCRFGNARPFDRTGVNTAYEVHGARQRITNCTFSNMMRGIWVANNYAAVTAGTLIAENRFRTLFYGIDFFHDRATARAIVDTRIERNSFEFDDRRIDALPRLDLKAAVQIASEYAQRDITITGNQVTKRGHSVTSAFVVVTGGASGPQRHDAIIASGNAGTGLTFGSFVRTSPTAGLGKLTFTGNRWTALAPSASMAIAAGDAVEQTGTPQPIEALTLGGGSAAAADVADRRVKPIYINALVRSLVIKPMPGYAGDDVPIDLGGAARIVAIARPAT